MGVLTRFSYGGVEWEGYANLATFLDGSNEREIIFQSIVPQDYVVVEILDF
jgi:hypothetical protein